MSNISRTNKEQGMEKHFFRASAADFKKIPGSPIAYWISANVVASFDQKEYLISEISKSEGKNVTTDNARFIRFFWEINRSDEGSFNKKWLPCAMGGDFRKWFGNIFHNIDWSESAREFYRKTPAGRIIREEFWNLPGITWAKIGSTAASFRFLPSNEMYQETAILQRSESDAQFLLGILNSKISAHYLKFLSPTLNFQLEDIQSIPLMKVSTIKASTEKNVSKLIEVGKSDWDENEFSRGFAMPRILKPDIQQPNLSQAYREYRSQACKTTKEMKRLEEENNRVFIEAYGLQDELTPDVPLKEITLSCNPYYRYRGDKTEKELEALLLADTMREFISYAVGCMFGRYSLDKPGLVLANQGETLADYLQQVPKPRFTPDQDNVIPMLDGEWFADDITERFRQFLRITFGDEHYDENLTFIEDAIGKDIRKFFLRDFYNDHVKRYKKRPIYWLFSSSKGTFNALIYLHRYRPDTVSVVLGYLRDFRNKLDAHFRHLQQVSISTDASQAEKTRALKEIDNLKKQLLELDDYERDTLYPLATEQIPLDLDDGVKVNYLRFGSALKKITGLESKED